MRRAASRSWGPSIWVNSAAARDIAPGPPPAQSARQPRFSVLLVASIHQKKSQEVSTAISRSTESCGFWQTARCDYGLGRAIRLSGHGALQNLHTFPYFLSTRHGNRSASASHPSRIVHLYSYLTDTAKYSIPLPRSGWRSSMGSPRLPYHPHMNRSASSMYLNAALNAHHRT